MDSGKPLDKLKSLSTLSGSDARFCIRYYLAQLSEEEAQSPEVLTLSIINALFSHSPRSDEALSLIEALPEKVRKEPRIQTFLGLSQHLEGKTADAIATLKKTAGDAKEGWKSTAGSLANGLEFAENRKINLLESLGKALDKLSAGGETLQLEVVWSKESDETGPVDFRVLLGISKPAQSLEIQLYRNQDHLPRLPNLDRGNPFASSKGSGSLVFPRTWSAAHPLLSDYPGRLFGNLQLCLQPEFCLVLLLSKVARGSRETHRQSVPWNSKGTRSDA